MYPLTALEHDLRHTRSDGVIACYGAVRRTKINVYNRYAQIKGLNHHLWITITNWVTIKTTTNLIWLLRGRLWATRQIYRGDCGLEQMALVIGTHDRVQQLHCIMLNWYLLSFPNIYTSFVYSQAGNFQNSDFNAEHIEPTMFIFTVKCVLRTNKVKNVSLF